MLPDRVGLAQKTFYRNSKNRPPSPKTKTKPLLDYVHMDAHWLYCSTGQVIWSPVRRGSFPGCISRVYLPSDGEEPRGPFGELPAHHIKASLRATEAPPSKLSFLPLGSRLRGWGVFSLQTSRPRPPWLITKALSSVEHRQTLVPAATAPDPI